jgi:membrane-associated phospholipid phosphatase
LKITAVKQSLSVFVVTGVFCAPNCVWAQNTDAALPDSPSQVARATDRSSDREVSWRTLPRNFLQDQKAIWLFPARLTKGRYWLPTIAIAGATAGLIAADPHTMPYFRSHSGNLDDVNDTFGSPITAAEIVVLPVSLMIAGYARHDQYQVGTSLLAGEAAADTAVVDFALNAITRRKRPSEVAPGAPFTDTFFNSGKSAYKGSSFPSGHAATAFSVATVVARRYRDHKWLPFALYGFATAVSFSRVTTLSHFPSDVFLGAALGYAIARYQVLPAAH